MEYEMINSGVEWIGEIPKEWKCMKAYHVFQDNKNGIRVGPFGSALTNAVVSSEEGTIKIYGQANLIRKDFEYGNNFVTEETYKRLKDYEVLPNDIAVSMMGTIGKCCVVPEGIHKGIMDSHLIKVRLNNRMVPKFFEYLYESSAVFEQLLVYSKGSIMTGLNSGIVKNVFLTVPPIAEQSAIASYLDEKCAAIDEIIAEAKATIDEYKSWKASVIFEAVTKGLNPNADMKDSGVEWIGKVPKNVIISKLKYLISGYKAGPFGSSLITGELLQEGNILVYTPEHIARKSVISDKNLFLPEERRNEMSQFFVEPGDIIFPIVGSLGRALQITDDMPCGIINQRLAKFRLKENMVDNEYFMWLFANSSFYSTYIELFQRGSIIVNLTKSIVGDMPFILHDITTQRKIAAYLDEKCAAIDGVIAEKEALIGELESYKKSLIFETVTGKRRVC